MADKRRKSVKRRKRTPHIKKEQGRVKSAYLTELGNKERGRGMKQK